MNANIAVTESICESLMNRAKLSPHKIAMLGKKKSLTFLMKIKLNSDSFQKIKRFTVKILPKNILVQFQF